MRGSWASRLWLFLASSIAVLFKSAILLRSRYAIALMYRKTITNTAITRQDLIAKIHQSEQWDFLVVVARSDLLL